MKDFYIITGSGTIASFGEISARDNYLKRHPEARKATEAERKKYVRNRKRKG